MAKKILVSFPPALLEHIDYVAQLEHRNRSDLIREAIRRYLANFEARRAACVTSVSLLPPDVADSHVK
jgi:metal-responsive CopG/Arc/MetJ family transcriptional regulator